jgi:hypothetical protein
MRESVQMTSAGLTLRTPTLDDADIIAAAVQLSLSELQPSSCAMATTMPMYSAL